MEISSRKMLDKIEDLLNQAKSADSEAGAQKYIIAIQAVCDLMLEGNSDTVSAAVMPIAELSFQSVPAKSMNQPSLPQTQPARIEGANGNSLLDF
ncbi:hypothetical protein JOC77_000028 [Peribacillus deserti]|uniref:YwdI family protein n=1 Tax=Peribacillus deserti TaxID=673318 RepID=A0ABS2QCC2_9BACI|nr:YwdI family protein [Peribacillus deserti]MBM7690625.1 hypothetical protein [Peribacillus deserti]